jgi:hypothetical protein
VPLSLNCIVITEDSIVLCCVVLCCVVLCCVVLCCVVLCCVVLCAALRCVALQDDNKLLEQLVTSLLSSITYLAARCQQAVDNLLRSWEQAVRTHPVDKLLEQHCYTSVCYTVANYISCHVAVSLRSWRF